jgi:acyl-CoA hydrolase
MLTDGYMHLRRSGILRREVVDERSGARTFLHASFFLGSKPFYEWLRTLSPEEARGLRMTRVSKVNDLYDPHETLLRRQRVHARFYNTAMQVTLLGEAMSETLPDGSVVSGVGGQYNFVAMSRELEGARSVLLLRSTRIDHRGRRTSNIVWTPGHVTIPRHLRDLVVTEYGIADLRGKSDEECIVALLQVCDHEFQDELLRQAQRAGKIRSDYILPERCRANRPENLAKIEREFPEAFKPFPFGSDFTPVEERLVLALTELQKDAKRSRLRVISRLLRGGPSDAEALQRLGLLKPRGLMQWLNRRLILGYLR